MTDWKRTYSDIEDKLMPHFEFDIYERGLYLYLLRHTHLAGLPSTTIPLSVIAAALRCSVWQARKTIRSLSEKGCIELDQTRKGHSVRVFLPSELNIPELSNEIVAIDIEKIDFFKDRQFLAELLAREQNKCFYCLRDVTKDNCELDHVVPQVNGGDNTYRNIVAACHRCNTKKQGQPAEDFVRQLYRSSLLSEREFEGRMQALVALAEGSLKPLL